MKKTVLNEKRNVEKKIVLGTTSQNSQVENPMMLIPHWVSDLDLNANSRNDKMVLDFYSCKLIQGNQR
jgi:hypothetical protein